MKRILIALLLIVSFNTFSQGELTRILFVLDASNSMNEKWGTQSRILTAKKILSNAVDSLRGVPNLELALRIYGHQSPITPTFQDCNDTKLEIPFGKNNHQAILDKVKTTQAKGTTPIALSLEQAADDFPDRIAKNVIILITDGIEACDGDPCRIATKLKEKGITISPFVIGLGMDMSYLSHFNCYGNYKSAEDPIAFREVLKDIINKVLVNTTVQINLNTIDKRPLETNVTMFLYKAGTKELKYTFTHTMNIKGVPDTLILNPDITYDLYVKTLPAVEKKNIKIIRNTHNIIEVDAPQGRLKVGFAQSTKYGNVEVRVMEKGKSKTLNVQKFDEIQKYLVGEYDLEILTLPRRYQTVQVNQSATTNITLPAPGIMTLSSYKPVTGQVFEIVGNDEYQWVCDLNEMKSNNELILQPGKYMVAYRQKDIKEVSYSRTKVFDVFSNRTLTINL